MTLLEAVRATLRRDDYARCTGRAYLRWIRAYLRFHGARHPREMGAPEVSAFLAHLANDRRAAAPTRKQAHHALLFLYRRVLGQSLSALEPLASLRSLEQPPPVLSTEHIDALLDRLSPPFRLIAELLYGSGLRLRECLALRLGDLNLDRRVVHLGAPARIAPLPARSLVHVQTQIDEVTHLATSAAPSTSAAPLAEHWLFPAARAAGLPGHVTPKTLRNSFARRLLEAATDLAVVQAMLGDKDRRTTRRRAQPRARSTALVASPLDLPPCPPHPPRIAASP